MNKFKLDKKDCALVIIDLQERLMGAMKDREKVYKNTRILLAAARQLNLPVFLSEQYPRGLGATVSEIKESLPETYQYMEKVSFSCCTETGNEMFAGLGRKNLLITGSETHVCVFQTVRDLLAVGYNVHLIKDAVCSRFDENYQNALDLMRDMGAVVTNTETVVFDLLQAAGTPDFKVISPLVK
ncbi:MAG: isochorismatase family protein [Syntrophomonas sp.]